MRGARSRVAAVVTTWLVALGLVVTGAVAPAASAAEGESSTTVTLARERWWEGEVVPVDIAVVRDGVPADGAVLWVVDGEWGKAAQLSDGRAEVLLVPALLDVGEHVIEVRDTEVADPTLQSPYRSSATATFRVEVPSRPVMTPGSRYYGDPATVQVDLTGTGLPRAGEVEIESMGTAPLVDGVATLAVTGTEVRPLSQVTVTQRDPATGAVISRWRLSPGVIKRPAALDVTMARTWQQGAPVTVTVRATSSVEPPAGTIHVYSAASVPGRDFASITSAPLVDGVARLVVDPDVMDVGDHEVAVFLKSDRFEQVEQVVDVTVEPRRTTSVSVSTPSRWTYGTSRRVAVTVSASGAAPQGRVDLTWANQGKVGSAKVVDGKASVLVGGTKLPPHSARTLTATFVPSRSTDAGSKRTWRQRVDKAKPAVRLTMDRTRYRVKADLGSYEAGTVRVTTAGLPERGRLVLETRSPRADNPAWRTRWSTDWALTAGDEGVQRVRVPAKYLRTADGRAGKVYLRFRYVPSESAYVSTVVSPAVTINRY